MSQLTAFPNILNIHRELPLPAAITRAGSKQTYYTMLLLVDRDRVMEALQSYAYFRWVDDRLDGSDMVESERLTFLERQQALVDRCYRGDNPSTVTAEEQMLVDLIQSDSEPNSGLQAYIRNMMAVMEFDTHRRGRLISQQELTDYTRHLAVAVTEALHYFIGHECASPRVTARYLAVTGAHITHMLRDTAEDIEAGYFNTPREFLEAHRLDPRDITSDAYRAWVRSQVNLARLYFKVGRDYLKQVRSFRCRIAGHAYIARFERVLDAIEREGYCLRPCYHESNRLNVGLKMGWSILTGLA